MVRKVLKTVEVAAQTLLEDPEHQDLPQGHPRTPDRAVHLRLNVFLQQPQQLLAKRPLRPDVLKPPQHRWDVVPRLGIEPDLLDGHLTEPELPSLYRRPVQSSATASVRAGGRASGSHRSRCSSTRSASEREAPGESGVCSGSSGSGAGSKPTLGLRTTVSGSSLHRLDGVRRRDRGVLRGLGSRAAHDGGRDVRTGDRLSASARVQRLQTALHAKAKEAPSFRFYSLSDKVWRDDVLVVARQAVRRNGGAAGVDGETVEDIESFGVERWLGALARDLTRCCRVPEEPMTFLGYRIGRNYRPFTGAAYIGTRPSRESVQSICRRVSETPRGGGASGSAASTRCETGNLCASRTSDSGQSTGSRALPRERRAIRERRHDLVREPDAGDPHVRFDERRLETEPRRGVRHRHLAKAAGNSYPLPPTATAPVVDSTRYGGSTTGRSNARSRGAEKERGRAEAGRARKRAVRRRTHSPAGRVGQSARIFAGRRRRVWLGQPRVHTGSAERLLRGSGAAQVSGDDFVGPVCSGSQGRVHRGDETRPITSNPLIVSGLRAFRGGRRSSARPP